MSCDEASLDAGPLARRIATVVAEAGGTALVVGGWVRDALRGRPSQDIDIELHGLGEDAALAALGRVGTPRSVGRAYPVWRVGSPAVEVSLADPASGLESAPGRSGVPGIAERHARAARRRDLTVNSMAWDPLARRLYDPCGGREDLRSGRLRATDPERFGEDPLRALRVARFAAQLEATPTRELVARCRALDLAAVAPERIFAELEQLLLTDAPARGLAVAQEVGVLRCLPELEALSGTPQDERWHPEGCVWTHTSMVVGEAALRRSGDGERDRWLMWSALCHDLGKPATTTVDERGVRSPGHDVRGAEICEDFLRRLRASERSNRAVCALVRWHLAPALYPAQRAGDRAYRRLTRRLEEAGVDGELLLQLAWADALGRTTEDALARRFDAGAEFAARLAALKLTRRGPRDAVLGRDVLARGVVAGPAVGAILAHCRAIQDETGWSEPGRILDRALAEAAALDAIGSGSQGS